MVIHGCLHLRGYDHTNAAGARVMETRERELLAGLGIADLTTDQSDLEDVFLQLTR